MTCKAVVDLGQNPRRFRFGGCLAAPGSPLGLDTNRVCIPIADKSARDLRPPGSRCEPPEPMVGMPRLRNRFGEWQGAIDTTFRRKLWNSSRGRPPGGA